MAAETMAVYVGLDCGGSSTRVVAVDELGSVLYQGQGGSANLASTPEKLLANNLRKATQNCPPPTRVCGCFAGLLTNDDRDRGELHLRHLFPYASVRAEPDYAAALFANEPFPDLCVICGTGSLICSRSEGKIVKSGGGGYILGDIGSAYQFGRDALRHFLYSSEAVSSRLEQTVQEIFASTEANHIVAKVYRTPSPAALIAKLARPLGQDALEGADYALKSLEWNMEQLAKMVNQHVQKFLPHVVERKSAQIVLTGGIWKGGQIFRTTFERKLAEMFDGIELSLTLTKQPPVRGAVKLAMDLSHGN